MAAQLFAFYPRNEANDPETFIAGATAMLSRYPEAVARKVCDPVTGLPSTNKFLPAISELREACEREMVWHDAVVKRERQREHTREVLSGHKAPVSPPEHARVVKGFANLRAGLEALQAAEAPSWKTMTPAQAEKRRETLKADYAAKPAVPVTTPEMAAYLDGMRAQEDALDEGLEF